MKTDTTPLAIERERNRCLAAVDAELELPDSMPDEMWQAIGSNKEFAELAFREAVRITKNNIRARIASGESIANP